MTDHRFFLIYLRLVRSQIETDHRLTPDFTCTVSFMQGVLYYLQLLCVKYYLLSIVFLALLSTSHVTFS
jgi:hypothetical protein